MAFATPNQVITQVPSSVDAPRKPDIVGIATLEIVESNICINVANDNAIVTHHNDLLVNGAGVDLVIAIKVVHYAEPSQSISFSIGLVSITKALLV